MSKLLKNILTLDGLDTTKNYLFIFAIDAIPPHIGFSYLGQYYAVSAKGAKLGIPTNRIVKVIQQKQIPTLLVELNLDFQKETVLTAFNKYQQLAEGQSCLLPINELLMSKDLDFARTRYIFEVLPLLMEKSMVAQISHLNCERLLGVNNSFELKTYTQKEIDDAIKSYKSLC